jgi:hypothetical protein
VRTIAGAGKGSEKTMPEGEGPKDEGKEGRAGEGPERERQDDIAARPRR